MVYYTQGSDQLWLLRYVKVGYSFTSIALCTIFNTLNYKTQMLTLAFRTKMNFILMSYLLSFKSSIKKMLGWEGVGVLWVWFF